jgi:hypothetical protein
MMAGRTRGLKLISIVGAVLLLITLAGAAVAGNNGGGALAFDAAQIQYVRINETASVQHLGYAGFTLEAWVYPTSPNNLNSVIRNNNDYNMFIDGNKLRANAAPGGDGTQAVSNTYSAEGTIQANRWIHVAAVWITPSVELFINGYPASSTFNPIDWKNGSGVLALGASDVGTYPFAGYMDEVRIWNTPHSLDQIRATMFLTLTGSEPNLVGYWPFNEGSGQITADVSGHGNTGTLGFNATDAISDPTWFGSTTVPLGALAPAYHNGVAGIWRLGITTSATDGVTTGLDIANVSFLVDDGDDIIFGHNDAPFQGAVTSNLTTTPNAKKRWARLWELDANDAGTTGGNVDLTFDISDAGGTGTFLPGGSYYLLKRATGSNDDFTEVPLVGSPTISGDRITFRVSVTNLGSEFTIGATTSSPTAVAVMRISASATGVTITPWLLLSAIGLGTIFGLQRIRKR